MGFGVLDGSKVIVFRSGSVGGDEVDAGEGEGTANDEANEAATGEFLEIPVEDGRTDNDGDGKEDELDGYYLGAVEALEGAVQVFDLENGSRNEDKEENVGDRHGDNVVKGG